MPCDRIPDARMELTALIHASVEALDGSDAVKQLVGICMRIRVSIRQRGKERKGKARPAMAKQAKQDRQADGSSTVIYMHALWLKLCGPSSRMCVCVCSSAVLLFVRPITLRSCENRPNSTTIIHGSGCYHV